MRSLPGAVPAGRGRVPDPAVAARRADVTACGVSVRVYSNDGGAVDYRRVRGESQHRRRRRFAPPAHGSEVWGRKSRGESFDKALSRRGRPQKPPQCAAPPPPRAPGGGCRHPPHLPAGWRPRIARRVVQSLSERGPQQAAPPLVARRRRRRCKHRCRLHQQLTRPQTWEVWVLRAAPAWRGRRPSTADTPLSSASSPPPPARPRASACACPRSKAAHPSTPC